LWEYICEMLIDIIKHSFIAKINDMKPVTYSEFLEDLYKQRDILELWGAVGHSNLRKMSKPSTLSCCMNQNQAPSVGMLQWSMVPLMAGSLDAAINTFEHEGQVGM
ncbi:hypothetical protein S83_065831, partial [Arachis hypogaea]